MPVNPWLVGLAVYHPAVRKFNQNFATWLVRTQGGTHGMLLAVPAYAMTSLTDNGSGSVPWYSTSIRIELVSSARTVEKNKFIAEQDSNACSHFILNAIVGLTLRNCTYIFSLQ